MTNYSYEEFSYILERLDAFNKLHGRNKKGISYNQLNDWFFKDYKGLLTHIKADAKLVADGEQPIRRNKKKLYQTYKLSEVVKTLQGALEIPEKDILEKNLNFNISEKVVSEIRKAELAKTSTEGLIYLVGSTYQGKQLAVKPRSIFTLNLKKKKVTFDYYGTNNPSPIQSLEGEISGDHLVYLSFTKGPSKKMYILKKGALDWQEAMYLKGTYVGDDGSHPMAGSIYCEIVDNLEEAKSKLHTLLDTGIQFQLLYTQFREQEEVIKDQDQFYNNHFNVAALEIKNNFKGTYYGCYLSSQGYHSILLAKLELNEDGSAVFYGNHNPEGEKGWIYLSGDKKRLYLRFKYNKTLDLFQYFITLYHDGGRLYGSYGGGSKFEYLPETGRIIFKKIDEKNVDDIPIGRIDVADKVKMKDFLEDSKVASFNREAISFLKGDPLVNRENDFSDTPAAIFKDDNISFSNQPDTIYPQKHSESKVIPQEFQKTYEAYIIQHFNIEPTYRIQKIGLEIKADQTVIAKTAERTFNGKAIKYLKDRKLGIYLSFQTDYPEIFHTLERTRWNGNDHVLWGTYSGRTDQNYPIGGRIILIANQDAESIDDIVPMDYDLADQQQIQELGTRVPGLLNYFMGLEDKMMEGYGLFWKMKILPMPDTSPEIIRDQVSGLYLSFRLRTDLESIAIVPLIIHESGKVKMKSTQNLKRGEFSEYEGVCEINDKELLSLRFYSYGKEPFNAQSKFNKSANFVDENENSILMGVFLSSNSSHNRPYACKQILFFIDKNTTAYAEMEPEVIKISKFSEDRSARFKQLNQQYDGIMEYLVGDEYNMIRMGRSPMLRSVRKGKGFKKKFEYGEAFYLAGLEYFNQGQQSLAKSLWQQALLNGFRDKQAIEQLKAKSPKAWKYFNSLI